MGDGEDADDALLIQEEGDDDNGDIEENLATKPPNHTGSFAWPEQLTAISPQIWVIFSVASVLLGRRVLTTGFPYPICFLVLLQAAAYGFVATTAVVVGISNCAKRRKRRCQSHIKHSWLQRLVIVTRYILTVSLSMIALICSMEALMRFKNLAVLAMLLILTYSTDGLLFTLAYSCRLLKRDRSIDWYTVLWALTISCFTALAVYNDYRINILGLVFALVGIFLTSISRLIASVGYEIPTTGIHTWDCSLYIFLWAGMPPCLLITGFAAWTFEDVNSAVQIVQSWSPWTLFLTLAPGVLTHLFWNSSLRATYPLTARDGAAYDENGGKLLDAIEATLQVALLLVLISPFLEENLTDWIEILVFQVIYVLSVTPRQISLYPPRFFNFFRRIFKLPERKMYAAWQKPIRLWFTTTIFVIFTSSTIFWSSIIAFDHDRGNWNSPANLNLDVSYRSPTTHRISIVVAHSAGEPVEAIHDVLSAFRSVPSVTILEPRIRIYTKDPSPNITDLIQDETGSYVIRSLPNIGGITATYLHHILDSWESLATHTIFLSTSPYSLQNLPLTIARLKDYYKPPAGAPYPEYMMPASGFLNLGELGSCRCLTCFDSRGWNDTFHLIPSMWAAARPDANGKLPGENTCQKVLLTYGNNFIASAQRIRGVKKDVWETLYGALTNDDLPNAWAHDESKTGGENKLLQGEKDSLEKPFLGYTVERLWGTLLQCSTRELAWRCPNMYRGLRGGDDTTDCGCID